MVVSSAEVSYDALIVDLNNFASFPTLAVGILIAALRNRGHRVEMISPLAYDVPATERERRETWLDHAKRRIHLSDLGLVLGVRNHLREIRNLWNERTHPKVIGAFQSALKRSRPNVILLSAYLQHYPSVRAICAIADREGIPVVLGGPMFNVSDVTENWRSIPGLTAVVGGEMDRDMPNLLEAVCQGRDPSGMPGVLRTGSPQTMSAAPPLRPLDDSPIPDFTDFPWDRYPVRIVPVMTGRGCQWDKCLFCSDVISASGRSFRTRSVANVLLELQEQSCRHGTKDFLFLDLKLNSWPGMIRGLAKDMHRYVHGAEWVGTVHVDGREDNGLSRADLFSAVEAGMRRVSFGLESGSQRMLDAMRKGTTVTDNSRFIRDAHDAGLSVRCTMFKGFPGETAKDMELTADFLEAHAEMIDRVRFNDFSLQTGTPIWDEMQAKAHANGPLELRKHQGRRARTLYRNQTLGSRAYRRAKARALDVVFAINRHQLRDAARQFDGLM